MSRTEGEQFAYFAASHDKLKRFLELKDGDAISASDFDTVEIQTLELFKNRLTKEEQDCIASLRAMYEKRKEFSEEPEAHVFSEEGQQGSKETVDSIQKAIQEKESPLPSYLDCEWLFRNFSDTEGTLSPEVKDFCERVIDTFDTAKEEAEAIDMLLRSNVPLDQLTAPPYSEGILYLQDMVKADKRFFSFIIESVDQLGSKLLDHKTEIVSFFEQTVNNVLLSRIEDETEPFVPMFPSSDAADSRPMFSF